jgi:TPR repeat protein
MTNSIFHRVGVAMSIVVLSASWALALDVTQCDELAGHPDDPYGVAEGVEDGLINLVAATPACETALNANTESERLQFQLGRVYWQADRDAEAVDLFTRSATEGGYPAAFAFLGLAYEYGYVDGSSNPEVARTLYEVARDGGFEPAEQLLQSLSQETPLDQSQIDENPDFSGFYQPRYLDAIYNRRFEELNADRIKVVVYLKGMYDFFKQEVNWFDLRCAHMHDTRLTQKILRDMFNSNPNDLFGNAETIFQDIIRLVMDSTGGGLGETAALALEMPILIDEGKRDAGHLVTSNNDEMGFYCESDLIKRLYKNAQYFFLEEMRL